jgi:hypothetical protein
MIIVMLIVNSNCLNSTGMLMISPMRMVPVCHIGDPVNITCTAPVQFISWSILKQGTFQMITNNQIINFRDVHQMATEVVNSITFTFMRTSSQGALPLVSTLSIDSVSIGLNGTIVRCSDVANPFVLASTTILIIDTNQSELILK